MATIDLKDRKLIYELQQDSRQSFKSIGKKIGMSSELVKYRIKRLIDNKIIQNYTILINWYLWTCVKNSSAICKEAYAGRIYE